MEFIEAPAFTRHIHEYLDDEGYGALQERLAANPRAGDVMPGTGGFRKIRWADPRRGKGRRGMMTLYGKNEAADLTPSEKKALKTALDVELKVRAQRRAARRGPRRLT